MRFAEEWDRVIYGVMAMTESRRGGVALGLIAVLLAFASIENVRRLIS